MEACTKAPVEQTRLEQAVGMTIENHSVSSREPLAWKITGIPPVLTTSVVGQTDREQAERIYKKYITRTLALDHLGNTDETVDAFQLKLNNEIKKPVKEQPKENS